MLLVNLGTPDSADAQGVRVYLKEFLSDPRVIENQGLFWKLVAQRHHPARPSAPQGARLPEIWNTERNESPLKTITRAQSDKLAAAIADDDHVVVDWAMRYGNPSIQSRIDALTAQGCDRLLVVPLYPQYSAATSATVCDEVFRVLAGMRAQPTLRVTPPYYDDPDYIEALAVSIEAHLATLPFQPEIDRGLVPRHAAEICRQGRSISGALHRDHRCVAQAHGARRLEAAADVSVALRLRRVAAALHRQDHGELGKDGVRRIAVVTPGFSADCLETLEEIAQENAEIFKHNGGEQFAAIPCLNDSDPGMDVIRQLVLRELQGWI